jgi:hypothetical protein
MDNFKNAQKLAKMCVKLGVKRLKTPEIELELADSAISVALLDRVKERPAKKAAVKSAPELDAPDDALLYHSTPITLAERPTMSAQMIEAAMAADEIASSRRRPAASLKAKPDRQPMRKVKVGRG